MDGTLHWDILRLYRGILDGPAAAGRAGWTGVGVDTWAVDYGLLDADGALLGNPVHYRDARTDGVWTGSAAACRRPSSTPTTGLQLLPFNTLYQLVAAPGTPRSWRRPTRCC